MISEPNTELICQEEDLLRKHPRDASHSRKAASHITRWYIQKHIPQLPFRNALYPDEAHMKCAYGYAGISGYEPWSSKQMKV